MTSECADEDIKPTPKQSLEEVLAFQAKYGHQSWWWEHNSCAWWATHALVLAEYAAQQIPRGDTAHHAADKAGGNGVGLGARRSLLPVVPAEPDTVNTGVPDDIGAYGWVTPTPPLQEPSPLPVTHK